MTQIRRKETIAIMLLTALALSGCSTSKLGSVSGGDGILGTSLEGTKGKTQADQIRIDVVTVRGCAASLFSDCKLRGND